ncbi:MAG: glycoside hydrolase [Leeuwenhoekiella sp.]
MKSIFKLVIICLSFILLAGCMSKVPIKIKGVSYVASRDTIVQAHIDPLLKLGATHAAVMPFGFIRSLDHPELIYNTDRQWFGETYGGVENYIQELHKNNIAVMIKPQIWVWRGEFTGDMLMKNDADWKELESSYEDFILLYAKLAKDNKVEIFCIGTELYNFVDTRTAFWKQLIEKVRKVYSGKLTYAENWDKVDKFPLWDDLDYIGVDAYFPVAQSATPTVAEARKGWAPHKSMLKSLSRKHNKPILFTEFGYRSVDFAGKEPWQSARQDGGVNLEGQTNLIEALFDEFWDETWFAGGFVWKWHHDHLNSGGQLDNRFTPQNKPAEAYLRMRYKDSLVP